MNAPIPGGPVVLDGGDRWCVQLLIELRRLVTGLAPGTVVHLIAADPAAPIDLPAWCHLTGHTYLGPVGAYAPRAAYALAVAAEARSIAADRPWHRGDR
ncbi:sulfurtransferase tusA [Planomonospora sphaerica]|uniref:Sulfurtransferase tusA n=1 Tax=Planomonospora sphaerica TaxID=161355 RepID=A0A161LLP1_9ACTN|nr:sulfurtransferase TusA family protein [Planomonospora sphaerica]GAT69807.1 sulfurtransferase tusA [Planomonospora sphaerica]